MRTVLEGAPVVMLASMLWLAPGCDGDESADGGSGGGAGAHADGGASGGGGDASSHSGGTGGGGTEEGGAGGGGASDGGTGGGGTSDGGAAGATTGGSGGALPEHLGCLGEPLPKTAPDNVVAEGRVTTIGALILSGVLVEGRAVSNDGLLGSDTTGGNGSYSITLPTEGLPLDAYLQVSSAGYVDSYFYPPHPFVADDEHEYDRPLITTAQRTGLADEADVTLEAGNGFLIVQVRDCNGDEIEGATVTTNPPGDVSYTGGSWVPSPDATSTDASGTAYIFNLPLGNVEVDASVDGYSLREHTIEVRADVVTITDVVP